MEKLIMSPRLAWRLASLALGLLGSMLVQPAAQARGVYLCQSASGGKELTDTYRAGCKTIDVPGSIAAPAPRSRGGARVAAPVSTPSDFPKVDNAQQKARDNDRREILNDELRSEEAKLAALRADLKGATPERENLTRQNISRSEKNLEALRREIANIK
ncbi:MAG: DUF4124 domain-containing protein [Massilia sp.]